MPQNCRPCEPRALIKNTNKKNIYIYIYIYKIELQGRLIPKVLDSDRGAVIKFFKQRNYCFPKQIVSGRSLLQWGMKNLQFNSHINGG